MAYEHPRYIEERLESLELKMDRMLELLGDGNQEMTMKEIAERAQCSVASLYGSKRYLLPDYGRGVGSGRKYTRQEVSLWLAKGEDQLKKEWKGES